MEKKTARKQINKLLAIDSVSGFAIGGAAWVALLAARGFSTIEIGVLESIFHIVSMICEIPSGVIADVFGRRRAMIAGRSMVIVSSLIMVFSKDFFTVALAIAFSALSYNLASGTREALAYDSLKEAGIEREYDKFASNDLMLYQIFGSVGTLMAGVALLLGYKRANMIDAVVGAITVAIALTLADVRTDLQSKTSVSMRFRQVVKESFTFIRDSRKARMIIIFNACIGAVDVLVLFFMQARLPEVGLKKLWLGPALFLMGIGAAAGAKAAEYFAGKIYKKTGILSALGVGLSFGLAFSGNCYLMIIGGFIGAFSDNLLQVRTDVLLNTMIPSDQRATLMSVNSFTFSIIMIVLSPLFGLFFS
ncbi:MAG: MFS transporter [Butyrivibrio sp.]|nr:MFS transporter [Butyrivibrio sp.]